MCIRQASVTRGEEPRYAQGEISCEESADEARGKMRNICGSVIAVSLTDLAALPTDYSKFEVFPTQQNVISADKNC